MSAFGDSLGFVVSIRCACDVFRHFGVAQLSCDFELHVCISFQGLSVHRKACIWPMQLQRFCATGALPHVPLPTPKHSLLHELQRLLYVSQLLLPQHSLQLVRPSAVLRLEQALECRQPLGALCPRRGCQSDLHGSQQEMYTSAERHKTAWAPRVDLTARDARAAWQCRKRCAGTARARQHRRSGSQHWCPTGAVP